MLELEELSEACSYLGIPLEYLAVAAPLKITKQYREDYVYNKKTDAFYKFNIEKARNWKVNDLCAIEGAQLIIPLSDYDIMQLHSMFKKFPDLGDCVWRGDDGQKHESAEEQPIIDSSAVADPPKITKKYRDDYVYNKRTDAFYKFHIEKVLPWKVNDMCSVEGAQLMIPSSDYDIMQLHSMFKKFPDLGNYVWVGDDGQKHESAEEQPIIDLSPKSPREQEYPVMRAILEGCDVATRTGDIENMSCYDFLPFICKVDAKDAPYDEHCGVYAKDYKYYPSVGSCYKIKQISFTWSQAYSECQAEGAHLLVINSEAEHDAIFNLTNTGVKYKGYGVFDFFFAGFRADKPVGNATPVFKTIFNQTLEEAGYSGWSDNEPNNESGKEFCGSIFKKNGKLNDIGCSQELSFICEKEVHSSS